MRNHVIITWYVVEGYMIYLELRWVNQWIKERNWYEQECGNEEHSTSNHSKTLGAIINKTVAIMRWIEIGIWAWGGSTRIHVTWVGMAIVSFNTDINPNALGLRGVSLILGGEYLVLWARSIYTTRKDLVARNTPVCSWKPYSSPYDNTNVITQAISR